MAKKPTGIADSDDVQTSTETPPPVSPAVVTPPVQADAGQPPLPDIPDPIFALDEDGQDRPMSGGSFIRLEDGTLIRNPEA